MKPLKIVSISDIHFGHKKVPIPSIAKRLTQFLYPELKDADLLIIGGDIYDTALGFSDTNTPQLLSCFIDLLREAAQNDVTVRILRGTYSHDRTQSANLPILHQECGFTNSLRYFDKLSLEYIEPLDLRVLYLPDDLPYASSDACLQDVKAMMADAGWPYVDYVFGHGYFLEVLPENMPHKPTITYRRDQFSFCKRYVLMGHEHKSSVFGNVIYNGSFDRLNHGQEDRKGFITLYDDGVRAKIKFIENTEATLFKTIDLTRILDGEAAIKTYRKALDKILKTNDQEQVHIRALHPSVEVRSALSKITAQLYPYIRYTHKSSGDLPTKKVNKTPNSESPLDRLSAPTPESLPDMIVKFLEVVHSDTSLTRQQVVDYLTPES